MGSLKYAVVVSALVFSGMSVAGTVQSLHIQTARGVTTEVLLPPGYHAHLVTTYGPYYRVVKFHFGKGASYQAGIIIVQKEKSINSDVVVNANNGNTYVIWTHNINHIPAKVIYNIH